MPMPASAVPPLVLSFHGLGLAPATVPADEVQFWMAVDHFAAFTAQAARWSSHTGVPLVFTFDDGNASDLLAAAPVLQSHGLPGAFFACTGRIGQPDYLSAPDLRELAARGFEVGSHGVDHRDWSTLRGPDLAHEVHQSQTILGEILGSPITTAALPFGGYNRRVIAELRQAGYRTVYSSDPGISPKGSWLCQRWTYVEGDPFDLDAMVQLSRRPAYRLKLAAKELVKRWR